MLQDKARVDDNTLSYIPKPGTMVIFNNSYGCGHGHLAGEVRARQTQIIIIENTWLGGGWTREDAQKGGGKEKATIRAHGFELPMSFDPLNFKDEVQTTWIRRGKFTADRTIKVLRTPGLSCSMQGAESLLPLVQRLKFDQDIKTTAYWWIRFEYPTNPSAGYFYLADCRNTDKKGRIKVQKYWGKITGK
ncbi:amidase [Staphylococcus phage vB_SauH_DELF3]|nr:amidase [Staphylococcus phage vB_SauH_DELF3]